MIQQPNLSLRRLLEQMFIRLSASDNLEKTLLAERNYDLYSTCLFFLKSIGQSFPGRLVPGSKFRIFGVNYRAQAVAMLLLFLEHRHTKYPNNGTPER